MFYTPKKTDINPGETSYKQQVPEEWGTLSNDDSSTAKEGADYYVPQEGDSSPFGEASPGTPSSSTRNVLNQDVTVVGTLRFTDDLLVDGVVEAEITSEGVLTVGANATIQSDEKHKAAIRTKSAIIHGKVIGDVIVTDRVELSSTAQLAGDVTAEKISIQEGAVFVGHCTVGTITAPLPASHASTPAPRRNAKRTTPEPEDDTPNLLG